MSLLSFFSVTSAPFLRCLCLLDGTVDGLFPVATKEGGNGDLVLEEVIGDDVEATGDGSVILGSLVRQDVIAGQKVAGMIDSDVE